MRVAVSWSGGKDSTLALDRASRDGYEITHLINIYEGVSGLVRFHGVRHDLIRKQAKSLGIELVQRHTHPDDYETLLCSVLAELKNDGVEGIVFGNIHLADIRAWLEERVIDSGLEHVEPLWGDDPTNLVHEFIDRGYASTIVGIDLSWADPDWLGARFDRQFLTAVRSMPDVDVCGERGEYHSFVSDGPLFRYPISFSIDGTGEIDGHRHLQLSPSE